MNIPFRDLDVEESRRQLMQNAYNLQYLFVSDVRSRPKNFFAMTKKAKTLDIQKEVDDDAYTTNDAVARARINAKQKRINPNFDFSSNCEMLQLVDNGKVINK